MKREILFRGKRTDNGEWVEGYIQFNYNKTKARIINPLKLFYIDFPTQYIDVNPETVCQFTGLTDKNGTKIFEGGIVRFYDDSEDELVNGAIVYNADFCSFCVSMKGHEDIMLMAHWQYELIGNIYDNPELLKQ